MGYDVTTTVVPVRPTYAEEPGPWTSIGLSLVVLSLVCLALGVKGKRDNTQ